MGRTNADGIGAFPLKHLRHIGITAPSKVGNDLAQSGFVRMEGFRTGSDEGNDLRPFMGEPLGMKLPDTAHADDRHPQRLA
jgi:hypothetical protein